MLYSILTPRIEPLRILVRRAALFSFSEKTVRVAALVPLVVLLLFFYTHRDVQMADLLRSNSLFIGLAGGATVAGLLYRDRARRALEGVFFHDRENARRLMGELAEKSRGAKDPASLEQLLSGEIARALHAESVALFVRDRAAHTFVCPSRSLPTLDLDSTLVGAAGTKGVLELDPADRRSPLATLPEIERHWVEESHARLLLPLCGADGTVIGLLTVGENLSEQPWDKEDKSLLVAAAASGALALENSLLRSSGGGGATVSRPARTHEEEDLARSCHLCSQIFSAALGPLCPKDQVPLAVADVPHVLAGKYRFERRIGSGGMGVVYLARELSLGRHVAVKTLPKVSPDAAMRLRREARATARVLHPNLAVIFAAETWHGTPMLILEYLEGGTLAPRIARGPIPIEKVVELGIDLSGALEAAHAKGVLHRDIKPSNIGFTASGEPKLLDFGLASLIEEPEVLAAIETTPHGQDMLETTEVKQLTVSGRIVGTLPYLAPEAILGETPQVSFDLWSLALTLYE
ncbi:MAG: serine/threonine-protein kinase, partial [Thermoanaerobaculia bacterium]